MNSKCGVQSKRKRERLDSCVCIAGLSACGCQKKSVVYETEWRHVAVQRGKQDKRDTNVKVVNLRARSSGAV